MTDHGCRCETCTTKQCPTETLATDEEIGLVSISHGLLCHSNARAWLMQDVIKELEKLYNEETTHSSSYAEGKADGYDRAISIIKGVME